jgi:hypothetical protein
MRSLEEGHETIMLLIERVTDEYASPTAKSKFVGPIPTTTHERAEIFLRWDGPWDPIDLTRPFGPKYDAAGIYQWNGFAGREAWKGEPLENLVREVVVHLEK